MNQPKKKQDANKGILGFAGLFMLGFLIGVLLPNFMWRRNLPQIRSTLLYLLADFHRGSPGETAVLSQVWKTRGAYILLWLLSGFSIFGIPLSLVTIIWMGFFVGAFLTLYILQFGVMGGLLGMASLLPQYGMYVPVSIISASYICSASLYCWKNKWMTKQAMVKYGIFTVVFLFFQGIGMLLESYINPQILQWLLSKWNFF